MAVKQQPSRIKVGQTQRSDVGMRGVIATYGPSGKLKTTALSGGPSVKRPPKK